MSKLLPKIPHGKLRIGEGRISAYLCFLFGLLSAFGVLAFQFPSHLTTPELREAYSGDVMRIVMTAGMIFAAGLGTFALSQRAERRFAWAGLGLCAVTMIAGGPSVVQGETVSGALYIGLDWLIIGLLSTGALFILLEKLAPLRQEQPVLREDWILDMKHFVFNHLLIGFFLFVANFVVHQWFCWLSLPGLASKVEALPFWVQFVVLIGVIDFMQYWVHRLYHENNWFWKIHSVHHSTETMDWLASSRLNFMEPMITRTLGLLAITSLGFEQGPINAYLIFVGFHATFIHANFGINLSKIEWLLVTPKYHHWHHADTPEAINKNYAVYLTFLDKWFGTQYNPDYWPDGYGVLHGKPPSSLLKQQLHPFMASS